MRSHHANGQEGEPCAEGIFRDNFVVVPRESECETHNVLVGGVSGWIVEGCVYIAEMLLSSLCHLFDRVGNESCRILLIVNECMKI